MMAGVYAAYVVVVLAYFGVAVTGYAAFGNAVNADVLLSVQHPAWLISTANFFVVIHLAASYQVRGAQSLEPFHSYAEQVMPHSWAWLLPSRGIP